MTDFERRQRMDERNRLRRMDEACLAKSENDYWDPKHNRRLFRFHERIEARLAELAEELGLRW